MKRNFLGIRIVGLLLFFLFFSSWSAMAALPTKQEVLDTMLRVQNHWLFEHPDPGDNKWARATCFEGTIALFKIYEDELYHDYALNWAEFHDFELNGGDYTRNADNQCAGQTYFALNEIDPEERKVEHVIASIDHMVDDTKVDDWWWIDALHMAMPVFTEVGITATSDSMFTKEDYLDKLWDLYQHTKYVEGGTAIGSPEGGGFIATTGITAMETFCGGGIGSLIQLKHHQTAP